MFSRADGPPTRQQCSAGFVRQRQDALLEPAHGDLFRDCCSVPLSPRTRCPGMANLRRQEPRGGSCR